MAPFFILQQLKCELRAKKIQSNKVIDLHSVEQIVSRLRITVL